MGNIFPRTFRISVPELLKDQRMLGKKGKQIAALHPDLFFVHISCIY
jgi:hypothetical protein